MTALDLCLPPGFACGFKLPRFQLHGLKRNSKLQQKQKSVNFISYLTRTKKTFSEKTRYVSSNEKFLAK